MPFVCLSSTFVHRAQHSKIFSSNRVCRDLNQRQLGSKRKHYLCAMTPPSHKYIYIYIYIGWCLLRGTMKGACSVSLHAPATIKLGILLLALDVDIQIYRPPDYEACAPCATTTALKMDIVNNSTFSIPLRCL